MAVFTLRGLWYRVLFCSDDNNTVVGVQPPGIRFTMFTTLCQTHHSVKIEIVGLQKSLDSISCSNTSVGTKWINQQLHYLIESLHNVVSETALTIYTLV